MKKSKKWLSIVILSICMVVFTLVGGVTAFADTSAETGAKAKGTVYMVQNGNIMHFHFDTSHLGLTNMYYDPSLQGDSNLSAEDTEAFLKKIYVQVNQRYIDEMTEANKTPKMEMNKWYSIWDVATLDAGSGQTYFRPKVYFRNSANQTGEIILVSDSTYYYEFMSKAAEFSTGRHLAKIMFEEGLYFVDGNKVKIDSTVTTEAKAYAFPADPFIDGNFNLTEEMVEKEETGAKAKGSVYYNFMGAHMHFHFDTAHLGLSSMYYDPSLQGDSNLSAEETEAILKKIHVQINQKYIDEMNELGKTPKMELNKWYSVWDVAKLDAGAYGHTYIRPKVYYRNSANITAELILMSDSTYYYHNENRACEFSTSKHLSKVKFDAGIYFIDGSMAKIDSTVTKVSNIYAFPASMTEGNIQLTRLAESISVDGFNENQNVIQNGDDSVIDVAGATITAYYDGQKETVELNNSYITNVNSSAAGEGSVTITYAGISVTKKINIVSPFKSIAVTTIPNKVEYALGVDKTLDLTGLVVEATLEDGINPEDYNTTLNVTEAMCSGLDYLIGGEQTITITYGALTTSFNITVVDEHPESYIDFAYGATTSFPDQPDLVCLGFDFFGITPVSLDSGIEGKFGAIWNTQKHENNIDKISFYIEGLANVVEGKEDGWYSFNELAAMSDGYGKAIFNMVSMYGQSILVHSDSAYFGVAEGREAGTFFNKEMVTKIRVEAGFYWLQYTGGTGDNWGGGYPAQGYVMVPNAIVRNTFEVEVNSLGIRWVRSLKQDAEGNIAEDALTIATMPTKTEYLLNETLDVTGMTVNVKYADGFEETVAITEEMIGYHDFSVIGEQRVYVTFNEQKIFFDVNVVEELVNDSGSDTTSDTTSDSTAVSSGCFGAVGFGTCLALVAVAASGLLVKKKRR